MKTKADYAKDAIIKLKEFADSGDIDIMVYLCENNIERDHYMEQLYLIMMNEDDTYDDVLIRDAAKRLFKLNVNSDFDITRKSYRKTYERAGNTRKENR